MPNTLVSLNTIPLNSIVCRYVDNDFVIIDFNTAVWMKEGVNTEEIIGKSIRDLFEGVDENGFFDLLLGVYRSGVCEEHRLSDNKDINSDRRKWASKLANGDILVIYEETSLDKEHVKEESLKQKGLEEAQKIIHFGYWEWNTKTDDVLWSDEVYRIFGEEPQRLTPTLERFVSYFELEDKSTLKAVIADALEHKKFDTLNFKIQREDDTVHYLQCSGKAEFDEQGSPVTMIGTVLDVTAQHEVEDQLKSLGYIVENSINEVYIFDAKTLHFTYINKKAHFNIGYTLEELMNMTPVDIKPEYTMSSFLKLIEPLRKSSQEYLVFETIHRRKNGSSYNVEIRIQSMEICADKQFVVMTHDISERVQMKEKLHLLATTDFLTGIYNRHKTNEEIEIEIGRAKRFQVSFALVMFDLDFFKKINDSHGHHIGDYVLQELCSVISAEIRESDRFGRWGGEEFIIVLPHLNQEQVMDFCEKLRKSVEGHSFKDIPRVTISIGATVFNENDTGGTLLKRVDDALYEAKKEGRNTIRFK